MSIQNMAKSNGITISFEKKNYSKNGTAGFEVNMTSYYNTIFTFITINVL